MSILGSLLSALTGEDAEVTVPDADHPCSNCPSGCQLAPQACSICEPYKKRLLDALYNVDHIDEIRARYEVVSSEEITAGKVLCPRCLGNSDNPYVCDYCGSQISEGNEKIKVASASDIPNPIMDAQDIIFERQEVVVKAYAGSDETSSGLGDLFGFLFGYDEDDYDPLGSKMSEAEIIQMAEAIGVPVSTYLAGLDDGKYPTLSDYKNSSYGRQVYEETGDLFGSSSGSGSGMGMGLGTLMGATLASMAGPALFGGSTAYGSPYYTTGSGYGSSPYYSTSSYGSSSSHQPASDHVTGSSVSQHQNGTFNNISQQVSNAVSAPHTHSSTNSLYGQANASSAHHAAQASHPQQSHSSANWSHAAASAQAAHAASSHSHAAPSSQPAHTSNAHSHAAASTQSAANSLFGHSSSSQPKRPEHVSSHKPPASGPSKPGNTFDMGNRKPASAQSSGNKPASGKRPASTSGPKRPAPGKTPPKK